MPIRLGMHWCRLRSTKPRLRAIRSLLLGLSQKTPAVCWHRCWREHSTRLGRLRLSIRQCAHSERGSTALCRSCSADGRCRSTRRHSKIIGWCSRGTPNFPCMAEKKCCSRSASKSFRDPTQRMALNHRSHRHPAEERSQPIRPSPLCSRHARCWVSRSLRLW